MGTSDPDLGFPSEWAKEKLPDHGPDWRAAIDYGIDVPLLLENLALSPTARLAKLQKLAWFQAALQAARLSP